MKTYLNLLKRVLVEGKLTQNRTNCAAITKFGDHVSFDLRDGFPLITTKKVFYKAIIHELLWFIAGSNNIQYLCRNGINIWNDWPFQKYQQSTSYQWETIGEFSQKIAASTNFAKKWGNLGPIYGKQWRNSGGVDQFKKIIREIKTNPLSRRLLICAWNVAEIDQMVLPPCHVLFQFHVEDNHYLSGHLYQRSADLFLGVPFNIASYALLLSLVAHECGLVPKILYHTFGNIHIYSNHLKLVKQQLMRSPLPLSTLKLHYDASKKSIFDVKYDDISIENYRSWGILKGKIAI